MDLFVNQGKFKLCKMLGEGAYGKIYQGINVKTNDQVAIKLESLKAEE